MKRDAYQQLLAWKSSDRRKPLILHGARQVGKTYLLQQFAQLEYDDTVYMNFEKQPSWSELFSGELDPKTILQALGLRIEREIVPGRTLIIFDEIQECPSALNSLKYFNEEANEYHIAAAGSLLGVKISNEKGFPVGKVNFIDLFPLNFLEFLSAIGRKKLRDYLQNMQTTTPIPEPIHQELITLLKRYMVVGGMPEAVAKYRENGELHKIKDIHDEILRAYELDFAKHAPKMQVMKISTIWDSVAMQLAKENKKFIFAAINKSSRARDYEVAIQWLQDAGLIYKSYDITAPKFPLRGYRDVHAFKIFLLDVGLLATMAKISPKLITEGDKLFSEYNGAFTENFAVQELACNKHDLFYWVSTGTAEVDFILEHEGEILPLEVKFGVSKKKKSLQVYAQKYKPKHLLRASLMNLKHDGHLINYPLYMIGRL